MAWHFFLRPTHRESYAFDISYNFFFFSLFISFRCVYLLLPFFQSVELWVSLTLYKSLMHNRTEKKNIYFETTTKETNPAKKSRVCVYIQRWNQMTGLEETRISFKTHSYSRVPVYLLQRSIRDFGSGFWPFFEHNTNKRVKKNGRSTVAVLTLFSIRFIIAVNSKIWAKCNLNIDNESVK